VAGLFIEIYWSVGEAIIKYYWRVLNCDFEDISINYYFSRMFLPAWKTAIRTAEQRLVLKVQNPVEVPST
jgi:hypothetical protein